jgi:CheY-like chemotaxis protein
MSPEVAARVFEPFFTTKTQDKGTGLGLSMVHGFVTQSGGFVDLRTAPGAGTTFRLYLPRHAGVAAAADAAPDAGAVPVGNETVLVVEDQAMVRALFVTMLGRIGYTVLEAGGGAGALELLDRRAAEIGLMVTDVVMPGMSGPELALETRRRHPGMKVLFASGHGETAALAKAGWTETADVLRKPFQLAELATAVRRAIDAGDRS